MEILFELICAIAEGMVEGMAEVATSKKVPLILRIICGGVLGIFYFGIWAIIIFAAVESNSSIMTAVAIVSSIIFIAAGALFVKKCRRGE